MTVLTVNVGSSTIRLGAFGVAGGVSSIATYQGAREDSKAAEILRQFLARPGIGHVHAVSHRVVHGGERLAQPCLLTAEVEAEIERLAPLAPLHNPPALTWVRASRAVLGHRVPQIAVFDTGFYATLPEVAAAYALPRQLSVRHGIRRYGFHGLAHQAMWETWQALRSPAATATRVISLQLGAGCSVTAGVEGRPVDTSMGFSPLEGLVMATRCGDVDAGALLFLQRAAGLGAEDLERILNNESGLLGVSGHSADMRTLLASDDPADRIAIELYCYRARKYVGAYLAALGGAEAILFSGGVGEHAAPVRERILAGMEWAGITLDPARNRDATAPACVSRNDSRTEVWVLAVDEARVLAEAASAVLMPRDNTKEVVP